MTEPSPIVTADRVRSRALRVSLLTIVLLFAGLHLYTRNNDFPMRYHPDESGKVDQILSVDRNYNHPQLLLELSQQLLKLRPTSDPEQAVRIGRTASAVFAAMTVAAGALLGYWVAKFGGMLIAAAVLLFSPPMVIYSHYMKEDAALMLGLVLCLLASRIFWGRAGGGDRSWHADLAATALMGVACAVAVSGKYVGAYAIAALLPLLLFPRGRPKLIPLRPVIFFFAMVVAVVLINHRIFADWAHFTDSLAAETRHGLTEHFDLAMDVPTGFFIRNTWEVATTPVKALFVLYLPLLLITWKRRSGWDVFPLLFLAVSTAIVSRCPIPFPRYGLPMVITVYVMAALAGGFALDLAAMAIDRLVHRERWTAVAGRAVAAGAGAVVLAAVLGGQVPRCRNYLHQFSHDSRQGLRDWLRANADPGASIAADFYAGLRDDGRPQRSSPGWEGFRVEPSWYGFAPQVAGWGNMRSYRYIAICDVAYERYMVPEAHGVGERGEEFDTRKAFYRTLIDRCTPVWKSVPADPMHAYTNPTIYLFDTTQLPADVR
jgi:hypothetical protein